MTNFSTSHKALFFSIGDPRNPSTWSNVPYCFVRALEERGYNLTIVDISSPQWLERLWNSTIYQLLRHFRHGHLLSFDRTCLASFIANCKIRRATRLHKDIDYSLFTTFGYYNKYSQKPSIQLCDWTLEFFITRRLSREAYSLEKAYIRRETKAIMNSSLSVSLFNDCKVVIEQQIPSAHMVSFNSNVVNIIDSQPFEPSLILEQKRQSNLILFIGNNRYLEGAQMLLQSFRLLSVTQPSAELAFVGLSESDLGLTEGDSQKGVTCYGYLNKSKPAENNQYYDLLRRAKVIVNTNEKWAGFSSIVEAMYYYTPVIVTPFSSFVDTFGSVISFGHYWAKREPQELAALIETLFANADYLDMCKAAHNVTDSFTWSNYVGKIEQLLV